MGTYYVIYGLLLVSALFELSNSKTKKLVLIFWGFFFTFFSGLRWQIGSDWDSYLTVFNEASFDNIFSFDRYGDGRDMMEPGYVFLNAIVKALFGKYHFFNLLESAFLQYSYYKAIKYFTPQTPIIMYGFLIIFGGFIPIRATLGLAIAFWGYKYIKEQELLRFLLIIALTCTIHMKFIIFLPCYWIGKIRIKSYLYLSIYLLVVGSYVVFQQQLALLATLLDASSGIGAKLDVYTHGETEGFSGLSYIGVVFNLFLMCVYLYLRKIRLLRDELWMNGILNMYLVSCCIYALFSDGMGDLARLATLFVLPQSLLLVMTIVYFSKKRMPVLHLGAISFFVLYFIYRTYQATSGYYFLEAHVPYKTIFDYNISFF